MSDHSLLFQRYVDGELGAGKSAAVAQLVRDNVQSAKMLRQLETVNDLLNGHASELDTSPSATHRFMHDLLSRLPATAPIRQSQIRLLDVGLALAMLTVIAFRCFGLAGSFSDLVPLTMIAIASMIAGGLLILMAGPLRAVNSGFLNRYLFKRINVGSGGVAVYRAVGIAIFIGGIWLTR